MSVCLSVCLSACLQACLPVCLSVCLSGCLSVCLSVFHLSFISLSVICHTCLCSLPHSHTHTHIHTCTCTVQHICTNIQCIYMYMCICIQTRHTRHTFMLSVSYICTALPFMCVSTVFYNGSLGLCVAHGIRRLR